MRIKLDPGAIMPNRAHGTDAGLDLYAPEDVTIWPHYRKIINTGVHVEIPEGYVGLLTYHDVLSKGVIYDLDKATTIVPSEGGNADGNP